MAADRSITCTNKDGDTITFAEKDFSPFILVSADGIYDNKNNVKLMENTMTDGAVYQSSVTPYRNIVIVVKDRSITKTLNDGSDVYISSAVIRGKTLEILNATTPKESKGGQDYADHRDLLDKVFKKKEFGTLVFTEANKTRAIDYIVESITSTGKYDQRHHTISLICPDPFFYDLNEQSSFLVELIPDFQFIHEFTSSGETFGHNDIGYRNIYNDSANENIGITIKIQGKADIKNPSVTRMETGKYIKVGSDDNPFILDSGDELIITTHVGNKHIYLVSDGVTTEVNQYLADGAEFIQLMRGDNNLNFDSVTGKEVASIEIIYRLQYARA